MTTCINRVRIAFVLPDARGGGAENVVIQLANWLSSHHSVFLLLGKKHGDNLSKVGQNVNCYELGASSGIKAARKIANFAKKNEIEVVIGTLGMAHGVAIASLFGRRNIRYIARIGNTVSQDLKANTGARYIVMYLYQAVLFLADTIIVQSDYMKNDLNRLFKGFFSLHSSVHRIYNPIAPHALFHKAEESVLTGINEHDVVSVGRLTRQKDLHTAITAFSYYKKVKQKARFHIIGTGTEMRSLQEHADRLGVLDSVLFHGYLQNPYPFMRHCSMFLSSSLYEGFSNVILEAVALGTPVVVSRCPGGNEEIVREGENGYFFDVGDPEKMADRMLDALELKMVGSDVSKYDISNIAKDYLDVACR